MTDIWHGIRTLIVIIFVVVGIGIVVWSVSKIQPAIEDAATLEARVNAQNARLNAEAAQAQTFVELQVVGTRTAIENEKLKAQAEADATTIAAQGQADSARGMVDALKGAIYGLIGVIVFCASLFILWRVAQAAFFARATRTAVEVTAREGGTMQLPNGHFVSFEKRAPPPALGAGQSEQPMRVEQRAPQHAEAER